MVSTLLTEEQYAEYDQSDDYEFIFSEWLLYRTNLLRSEKTVSV
jgi:hypothetical protein